MTDIFVGVFIIAIMLFVVGGLISSQRAMKRNETRFRATMDLLSASMDEPLATTHGDFMSSTFAIQPSGSSFEETQVITEVEVNSDIIVAAEVPDELIVETDRFNEIELED